MSPSFGHQYMKFMIPSFVECTKTLIKKWEKSAETSEVLNIHSEITRLTLDVIGIAGFGYNFNAVEGLVFWF